MGQRNRQHAKPHKRRADSAGPTLRALPTAGEKKAPIAYGKPFVLLEDGNKDTFIYSGGQWTRHTRSIAECRVDSLVKELAQKINGMTRYEICSQVATAV
jgi:hypothetical protein